MSERRRRPTRLDAARQATGDPSLHTLIVGRSRSRPRALAIALLFAVLSAGLVVGSPWATAVACLALLGAIAIGGVVTIAIGEPGVVAFRSRMVDLSFGPDYVVLGPGDLVPRSERGARRSNPWLVAGWPVTVGADDDRRLRDLLACGPRPDTDAPPGGALRNGNSSRDIGS